MTDCTRGPQGLEIGLEAGERRVGLELVGWRGGGMHLRFEDPRFRRCAICILDVCNVSSMYHVKEIEFMAFVNTPLWREERDVYYR